MDDRTAILRSELDELRAQISSLESGLNEKPDYGLGEGDPLVTRQELDRALLGQLQRRVAVIEQTLASGVAEDDGACQVCGRLIHPDRLKVLPSTKVCVHCARAGASVG